MFVSFIIFLLICNAILLVGTVLLQNPKDDGGDFAFLQSGSKQLMGMTELPSYAYTTTKFLTVSFFSLTMLVSFLVQKKREKLKVERHANVTYLEKNEE